MRCEILSFRQFQNAYCDLMALRTCHRIFVRLIFCFIVGNAHLWIICHHRLVHAIESHLAPIGRHEDTSIYAPFISMNRLPIYYFPRAIKGNLFFLRVSRQLHIYIMVTRYHLRIFLGIFFFRLYKFVSFPLIVLADW